MKKTEYILEKYINEEDLNFIFHDKKQLYKELLNLVEYIRKKEKTPTEDEVINTILNCVHIRGIELQLYRREFTEKRSGLINELKKLYHL